MPRGQNLNRVRLPRERRAANLGVEPLEPGEHSDNLRIRARREVWEALARLTPRERGRVVEAGLEALGLWKGEEGDA